MIDTHVHFWNFDPVRDSWINEEMINIQKDFLPADLADVYKPLHIQGCVAVQASQSEAETTFLVELAQENPLLKGVVGWVDLKNENLSERLTYWKQFQQIKGWRHVLQAETADFLLDKSFINGLKQLKNFGYTYDLLCYHDQLESIIEMVNQVPDQAFVLDHCGKPNIKSKDIENWKTGIKTLAQNPNVHCKISGLLTEADWFKFTETEIFDCLDVVFEHFGVDRLMYGSDWPVVLVSRPYADWFNLVNKYLSKFTEKERQKFYEYNAKQFYKLT